MTCGDKWALSLGDGTDERAIVWHYTTGLDLARILTDGLLNEIGESIASVKTAWRAACRRAAIAELHFHDLRREFGSRLLEPGASEHDVRDFLGHANITTTSRYLKSTSLRLERALEHREEQAAVGQIKGKAMESAVSVERVN